VEAITGGPFGGEIIGPPVTPGPGAGIVRFRSRRTGEVVGHGILIDDEHVATCAHVINAVLDRDLSSSRSAVREVVRLEFPVIAQLTTAPPERHARVDSWEPPGTSFDGIDVAGLTLVSEPRPTGAVPMPLASEHHPAGDVLLYGAVAGRPGAWVTARLRPLVTPHRQQIDQSAHGAFAARPGFSGTPIVDSVSGHVLGLLVATAVGRESTDIYAIPLPSIVSSWPQVFGPIPPSPYKGLRAFESEDRELFFGRTTVVRELTSAVAADALVPIVGASGTGKSSVIYAGLLPLLEEQEEGWGFVTVRPRPTLPMALAAGLARLSDSGVRATVADVEGWQGHLSRLGLAGIAELACAASGREHLLVTVDQFEEVLTQDCGQLLQQLAELPEKGVLTVVLALREDSFGAFFVRHAAFGERLRQSAVALRGMDRGELHEAVRGPAALRGVRIADRLVEELAEAVRDRPGALPLLEFSLDQMWRTLQPGQQSLSFDAYEEIGRLDGALADRADRILAGLNEAERAVVRRLFVSHLTSPERPDVRRVLRRPDCVPGDWQIIVRLANERLLTIGRDADGNETAEVVHEALLRAWGQLRDWLDAERPFRSWRQLLRYAMAQRPGTAESGAILTGELLAASEQWLAERAADLDLDERRFIEMSLARHNEEERRWQVLYHRSAAWRLISAAENADDPVLALLLAIEAVEHTSDVQAIRLVRTRLRRLGAAEITPVYGDAVSSASWPDRQRLTLSDWSRGPGVSEHWLLGDSAGGLIIDEQGQAVYGTDTLPMPGPVVVAAYARSGAAFLGTEVGDVAVWDLADRARIGGSRDLGVPVSCIAVSDTAQTLAAACDDGIIRVLHGKDLSSVADLSSPGFIRDIDVTNRLVAALSHDRRILVWDLLSQALICETAPGMDACRVAVEPGEDYVVVGDAVASGYSGLLPVSAQALTAWARQAAGRELTDDERNRYIGEAPV
jgi:Novel STAND NTPase 1/Trypsin-like peptidase domain